MPLDQKVLLEIKEKLEESKQRIEGELSKFAQQNPHNPSDFDAKFPDLGNKEDENAMEVAAYTDQLSLERTLEESLKDVNSALRLMKSGNYGVCKYCKKEIPIKRLLVRPESSSCIECKTKLQSGQL